MPSMILKRFDSETSVKKCLSFSVSINLKNWSGCSTVKYPPDISSIFEMKYFEIAGFAFLVFNMHLIAKSTFDKFRAKIILKLISLLMFIHHSADYHN